MFVYVMYDKDDQVLYVGKTKDMYNRMSQHFGVCREDWKDEVYKMKVAKFNNEVDMSIAEIYFINKFRPKYNK